MQNTLELYAEELDENFVVAIRNLFQGRWIKITVTDDEANMPSLSTTGTGEIDETEYLMSSPANHAHLMKAIQHVKDGKELIHVNLEDYQ